MKIKTGLSFFILYSVVILGVVGHYGCANIVPPTGGPKDTIPPRLVSALPVDSVRHFAEKKIILTFNE